MKGIVTNNPSIRIYSNKIENGISFKIKKGYYIELFTSEKMELLGSTECKMKKKNETRLNMKLAKMCLI